ncbi:MAG: 2OG-Fe(II) oxygenase [Acidimicrobiia bacterium]
MSTETHDAFPVGEIAFPSLGCVTLDDDPFLRFANFLPDSLAGAVEEELREGIDYERVELSDVTLQWRARRPVGGVYRGPMIRRPGWSSSALAEVGMSVLDSDVFVAWLSKLADEPLTFLRPATAYRMVAGDRLCLHDDMSDPQHAVSVAYNLSAQWRPEWGGATRFGSVTGSAPLPTPADCPIKLTEWRVTDERRFAPQFNSLVVMKLDERYAHGVAEITGPAARYALVGIYGRPS